MKNKGVLALLSAIGIVLCSNVVAFADGVSHQIFEMGDSNLVLQVETLPTSNLVTWKIKGQILKAMLYKNGDFIGDVTTTKYFEDTDLPVELASDTYTLDTVMSLNEVDFADDKVRTNTTGVVVDRVPTFLGQEVANATYASARTELRYRTFIREPYTQAPPQGMCGDPNLFFKGDDRSYGPTATGFRTSQIVVVDWTTGTVSQTADTGHTIRGTVNAGVFSQVDSKHASALDIQVPHYTFASGSVQLGFRGSALNPYCTSLTQPITYAYEATLMRSGSYSLQGSALLVPDHEAYIRQDSAGSWVTILKRSNLGFYCLNLVWASWECSTTNTYTGTF